MRWLRLLLAIFKARFRSPMKVRETSVIPFRVWLTDIDASIMNHAAMMSVFETGRIDYMVRTGFFRLARKNRWYFPSASMNVQFFRPLKMFQKAWLHTSVFHVSEDSIYTEQKIIRDEKLIAVCVARNKVKKQKQDIPPAEILRLLGSDDLPPSVT